MDVLSDLGMLLIQEGTNKRRLKRTSQEKSEIKMRNFQSKDEDINMVTMRKKKS